jgi:hypothetical protein
MQKDASSDKMGRIVGQKDEMAKDFAATSGGFWPVVLQRSGIIPGAASVVRAFSWFESADRIPRGGIICVCRPSILKAKRWCRIFTCLCPITN